MDRLTFCIPGTPKGKGRPRATVRGGNVRLYTPAATANYENLVMLCATQAMLDAGITEPRGDAAAVVISVRFAATKAIEKKNYLAGWADGEGFDPHGRKARRARAGEIKAVPAHTSRPDLDNIIKAVLDGVNGVALRDDASVNCIMATKGYGRTAGVQVDLFWESPVC